MHTFPAALSPLLCACCLISLATRRNSLQLELTPPRDDHAVLARRHRPRPSTRRVHRNLERGSPSQSECSPGLRGSKMHVAVLSRCGYRAPPVPQGPPQGPSKARKGRTAVAGASPLHLGFIQSPTTTTIQPPTTIHRPLYSSHRIHPRRRRPPHRRAASIHPSYLLRPPIALHTDSGLCPV